MSVISGGIFSKPRGKTGGIVFGAARTRNGKLATARELVKPSNPNTADQQTQRNKFSSTLDLVRRIGVSIYQIAWNRSIGQLPGFQSMMSIFLNQMNSDKEISLVNEINLGTLNFPESVSTGVATPGQVDFIYSSETGSNGTAADKVNILLMAKDPYDRELSNGVVVDTSGVRSDGSVVITGLEETIDYESYFYMEGVGTADGLYSVAKPFSFTTS